MSEKREPTDLDRIVDATPGALLIIDRHGVIRAANESAAQTLCSAKQHLVGRPVDELVAPDEVRSRDWHVRDYFETQDKHPIDVVHGLSVRCDDGTDMPVDLRLAPITLGDDVFVTAELHDVTSQKQDADRKNRAVTRLNRLFASSIAGAAVVDLPSGTVIGANDTLLDFIGHDRAALEAGDIHWESLMPRSRRRDDRTMFDLLVAEGAAPPYDTELERKDGGRVPVSVAAFLAPARDTEAILVVVDRTKEKDAEQELARTKNRLEESQRVAHVGSAEWAPLANKVWWTEEMYRLFDVPATAGALDYDVVLKRIHPDDRRRVDGTLRSAAERGESFDFEHRVVHRDGTVRWLHNRGSYLVGAHDRRLVGVAQDVTESKHAEAVAAMHRTARHEMAKIEEMAEFRARFVGMAAHELKNPLSPLSVEIHLMSTGELGAVSEKQQASLGRMQRSYIHLRDLTEDMLDAARMHAERLHLVPTETNVSKLVHEAVDVFRNLAERDRISLDSDIDPDVHATIDFRRINQVLTNLLSNAIKFTPANGTIRVVATTAGDDVRIEVHDTGVGLEADQLDQLFAPFKQVHERAPKGEHGTGLGLYVSKGIVDQHGGQIYATSDGAGQGSVFAFTVPKTPPAPKQEKDASSTADEPDDPPDDELVGEHVAVPT